MVNLDTNIVIFALKGLLNSREREAITGVSWAISSIVLWELANLVERRNLDVDLDGEEFSNFMNLTEILPMDIRVARTSAQLDFRSDPADELIAATSIVYGVPLVTRDRVIRNSKMVPLAS